MNADRPAPPPDAPAGQTLFPPERIAALRQQRLQMREHRIERFKSDQRIGLLMHGLAQDTDQLLRILWTEAGMPVHWALFAVGGYGRGELQPHSDVDLLLLAPEGEPSADTVRRIEQFIGACWDIGLDIGHSVRTPVQCGDEARADITTMTALLERRLLAGSRRNARLLSGAMAGQLQLPIFLRDKLLEMRQRHQKYEDTPYSLEPNCKESPGALRDLQVVGWISRAAGFGQAWVSLVRAGVIEPLEASQLQRHERLLKRIRAWLHILSGRREDRLVFDLQPAVARAMRLKAGSDSARALSEKLMQQYYLAAKAITQLSTILVQSLEIRLLRPHPGPAVPLDEHFDVIDEQLDLRDPDAFERDPGLILRAFRILQLNRSLSGMTVRTLRALWHARFQIDGAFRRNPANRALFLSILQTPVGITHTLRLMNQWSVLGRYLVPFWRIVGRMQHDLFHVYTVDQHILMVIRNLRRFMMAEHAHEYPFCSQLMSSFEKPWLLIVAALFHDIAKGRGGDHSLLGERTVLRFCRDYGIDGDDRRLLAFLVREHLSMSMTAQKRDLADPDVIDGFARRVGNERQLTALYLLTVADIRGTSARVWNAWKGKLLEDLYRMTRARLAGTAGQPHRQMDTRRSAAAALLAGRGIAEEAYQPFWALLDIGYFLRHAPQDVAWHTEVLHPHAQEPHSIVRGRAAAAAGSFEFLIFTPDKLALFARICRFFDHHRLSIAEARIHTTRHGMALDSFVVVSSEARALSATQIGQLENALARLLDAPFELGDLKPAAPFRLSRRSRAFPLPPKIDLRPDESGQRYQLVVTATDRPGLLYDLARVLAQYGVGLFGARITTLGERAEDSFTIGSEQLGSEAGRLALEKELLAVL
ncbi:MAG: [protein-PII] uridylyltransferase [Lautropia sp.]|nr:[protein-PII] uridylyltransferase [Lautropia sp.]